MKAEISTSELWFNPSVRGFFFSTQGEETFAKIALSATDQEGLFSRLDDDFKTVDDLDEYLHETPDEEIWEEYQEYLPEIFSEIDDDDEYDE